MANMSEDWNETFWNTRRNNPVNLSLVLCGLDVDGEDHVDGEDSKVDVEREMDELKIGAAE